MGADSRWAHLLTASGPPAGVIGRRARSDVSASTREVENAATCACGYPPAAAFAEDFRASHPVDELLRNRRSVFIGPLPLPSTESEAGVPNVTAVDLTTDAAIQPNQLLIDHMLGSKLSLANLRLQRAQHLGILGRHSDSDPALSPDAGVSFGGGA